MAGTSGSSGSQGTGSSGGSGAIDAAMARFKQASDDATAQSLDTSCKLTQINGVNQAIKQIHPA